MRKVVLALLSLLVFFSACGYEKPIKVSGKSVKIGVLVPMTGINKRYAKQSLAGLNAALKMQKYLHNGDKLKFIIVDTKSNVAGTRKAIYQLKSQGVKAIISFLGSDETLVARNTFKDNTIPVIVTLATNDEIPSIAKNIAQVCFDNNMQSLVAAHYIKDEKLITHVGIIYDRTNHYSYSLAKAFKKYYKSIGGEIDFYLSAKDQKEVQKLVKHKNLKTKIIYNTTDASTSLNILKIIKNHSWDVEVLSGDGFLSSVAELSKNNISKLDGVYVTEHYANNVLKSKARKKLEKLLSKHGYNDSSYAFLAYDGYQLLYNALEQCEGYESGCLRKHLLNSQVIKGASGNFSMINAKARREIYINKIHHGKLNKEIVTY